MQISTTETPNANTQRISDLSYGVITLPLSIAGLAVYRTHKKTKEFVNKNFFANRYEVPEIRSPYKNIKDKKDFIPIITNISNNLRNLMTIYGILLSFIVTTQLDIIFRSWTFAIWSGFILAVIARAGHYGYTISDIWEREEISEIGKKVNIANLFYRHATYMFVPLLVLTPIFFLIPKSPVEMPFSEQWILMSSIVLAIASIFTLFSWLFWFKREGHVLLLYMMVFVIFMSTTIASVEESPIRPYHVTIFNSGEVVIPASMYFVFTHGASLLTGMSFPMYAVALMWYCYDLIRPRTSEKSAA